MIRARLEFFGREAGRVAGALKPDNLPGMDLLVEGDRLVLRFSAEKIGTLLATADDILMNIKIAEETLDSPEDA